MPSKDEVTSFINTVIESLTWERLAMVVTVCTFGVLGIFAFDARERILDLVLTNQAQIDDAQVWVLSAASKKEFEVLVDTQALVGGAIIWDVDLKKNKSTTIFLHPKEILMKQLASELALPQSFFDTEPKSRAQMVAVISNSFTCGPTVDVTSVRPLANKLPSTCFLAIPPYSGGFVGFIGLVLARIPTAQERDSLRIELTRIAISVYLRDVENASRRKVEK